MKRIILATLCIAFGAILAYALRSKAPTVAELQAALSNNAAAYFRAGVLSGVAIDRARPGLTPTQLSGTARAYFVGLGHDPYLSPPGDTRIAAAERALSSTKRAPLTNMHDIVNVTTNEPTTNATPETHTP